MTTLESLKNPPKLSAKASSTPFSIKSLDSSSFEEIHKTSYSHGLEAIYALENIDIKSVRRINTTPKTLSKKQEEKKVLSSLQEEFDLGKEFRDWIPSFIKREPIHVLELSKHAEKCLYENGKQLLGDLIGINLKDFVFLRGMGQGHIEEIQQKLSSYLEGHDLDKCSKVDFSSWLKCLVATQDRKKVYTLLEMHDLASLYSLTSIENAEIRKLTLEKKQEWIDEVINKINHPLQKQSVKTDMQQIIDVFFKSWIRQRDGFASKNELQERMLRISTNPLICENALHFLQSIYFEKNPFFNSFLQEIDQEIYCVDEFHATNYHMVIKKTSSYFYKPTVFYFLPELISLLERDFAKSWIGFTQGYIEKILRLSPIFRTVKGPSGHLEIYIN